MIKLIVHTLIEYFRLMDWTKLACLLCSRGFKDMETMQKHRIFSSLHLQNLNKLRCKYGLRELSKLPAQNQQPHKLKMETHAEAIESLLQLGAAAANSHARDITASKQQSGPVGASSSPYGSGGRYRDRAKERREKFGTMALPRSNHKDDFLQTVTVPSSAAATTIDFVPGLPTVTNGKALGLYNLNCDINIFYC